MKEIIIVVVVTLEVLYRRLPQTNDVHDSVGDGDLVEEKAILTSLQKSWACPAR